MRVWNSSVLCLLFFSLFVTGCTGGGHARFIPSVESAREAVEMTLQAWKEGQPFQAISDFEPAIQPVDSRWQQGRKLLEFEILKELEVDGTKQIQVRIKLEGKSAAEETTYVVLGQDPLYVYWLTDYEQSSKTM